MGADGKAKPDSDLDFVLSEIGEFGPYQIWNYILIAIPIALSATYVVGYIFTATALDYR